jgi:hypothetical protein
MAGQCDLPGHGLVATCRPATSCGSGCHRCIRVAPPLCSSSVSNLLTSLTKVAFQNAQRISDSVITRRDEGEGPRIQRRLSVGRGGEAYTCAGRPRTNTGVFGRT